MREIKNDSLKVCIQEKGASLWSIKDDSGNEYLWQGEPKYWADRAPNLFPYIARLTEGKYRLDGKTYEMDIHGFAKDSEFEVADSTQQEITFRLHDTEETYRQYPYRFVFDISYRLEGKKLFVIFTVKNEDEKVMYFGVGGHPGFRVPMEEGLTFEDYCLEFDTIKEAKRVGFSEDCFVTGEKERFELAEGRVLSLHHDMFDEDAIVLTDMAHSVTLTSEKGKRAIRVSYPDMDFLGLWHMPKTDAPYICIEPWSSLPSRKGIIEDLETQPNLISLEPQCTYVAQFSIELVDR